MYQGLGWLLVIIIWVLMIVIASACIIGQFANIIISTISIIKPQIKVLSVFNLILYIISALFVLVEIGIMIFANSFPFEYFASDHRFGILYIVIFVSVQTVLFIVSRVRRHKYLKKTVQQTK